MYKEKIRNAIIKFNNEMDKTTKSRLMKSGGGHICQFCNKTNPAHLIVPIEYKYLVVFIKSKWQCICPSCLEKHLKRLSDEKEREDILTSMINDHKASLLKESDDNVNKKKKPGRKPNKDK